MMATDFEQYRLADASVKRLLVEEANVWVHVHNWRDEVDILVFADVIGLEAYRVINTSLSHGTECGNDPFLIRCCEEEEETEADFRCYRFVSAWTDRTILKIIARSFELEIQRGHS